jgi:hypothetical protein
VGDVVVVLAGAGAVDDDELVAGRNVVVVDAGAATDDGSPVSQFWDVCTAEKNQRRQGDYASHTAATATSGRRSCDS